MADDAPETKWRAVAASRDVPTDKPLEVLIDGSLMCLARCGEDIVAVQGLCPHQSARLAHGIVSEGRVHCPRHKASFGLTDGTADPGWDLPPLRRFAIREVDGMIEVALT